MPVEALEATEGYYFPISPLLLFPQTRGKFAVYLRVKDRYLLYAHPEEPFTEEHQTKLHAHGVKELYVLTAQREQLEAYLQENLGHMLLDEQVPLTHRSQVFYDVSVNIVRDAFENRLPSGLQQAQYDKIMNFVSLGVQFLARQGSLKSLAALISHHYQTYSHCVHVFVLTTAVLQGLKADEETLRQSGLGAILHDLGKATVPRAILDKPGRLTRGERQVIESHPVRGVGLCSQAPLNREAINCILFHHERMDGQGYPARLSGPEIPLAARAVSVCDVYDAMTSHRAYARARTPFQALSVMREELGQHLDPEVFKHLVLVLSGAKII